MSHASPPRPAVLTPALAGLAALFVGLGLGRFAYTPLLPALVTAGWFTPGEAAGLGAANLIAYLAGAMLARPSGRIVPLPLLMRGAMLATAASLAVCGLQPALAVFGAMRALAGVTGGVLMVLGPPSLLAAVPAAQRGRVGGIVFAGVGIGIVAASSALPLLLRQGVPTAWFGLAVAALAFTAIGWRGWPPAPPPPPPHDGSAARPLLWLVIAYGMNAITLVPHMVLISDYVARGLGAGVAAGSAAFVVYGIGAAIGPVAGGAIGDRLGFRRTLDLAVVVQTSALLLPALMPTAWAAFASALLVGALTPGIPPLVLNRAVELAGPAGAARFWRAATIAFAIGQAVGAWSTAAAFARLERHPPLFVGAAVIAVVSLALLPRDRAIARQ
jgi:predicted MFS family arabinose efflux permease